MCLHVDGLGMGFGGTGDGELLRESCLRLVRGRRYGLVGRNGVGKSTLLAQIPALCPEGVSCLYVGPGAALRRRFGPKHGQRDVALDRCWGA